MKILQIDKKIKTLCLIYFMVAQSSMMARATSDSFLLKYFQPESIPLMIMAAASLSIVLALLTTYLCGRFQAYGAMRIATAGIVVTLLAMVCLVYIFGNKGETKPIYVFAYMLCETIVILPMVLFWGMAMGVLNPTESKKWMGLIGAAGTLGCILAGFTISIVSKQEFVNELSLALVAGVLMVVSLILMVRAELFKIKDDDQKPVVGEPNSVFRKLAVLISSRQSILMTWLVVFSAIVLSLVDINFKFEVRKDYSEDLYDFFGQFYTYTSCAQLILQLFIVKAILTRGGVMAAISILPILLLLTAIGALIFREQDAVYVGKFITQVVFFTIEYVGLQMLFLSVKKKSRGQMNSAVDGLTRPATIAIISLIITSTLPFWQGGTESDSVFRLNLIIIALCLCWLFVAFLNYKQYLSSLLSIVGAKLIRSQEDFDRNDKSNESKFQESLTELSAIDYQSDKKLFLGLLEKLIKIAPKNKNNILENKISLINDRFYQIESIRSYLSEINKKLLLPRSKTFANKEFQKILVEAKSFMFSSSQIPSGKQYQELTHALIKEIQIRKSIISDLLTIFNQEIDFLKLFDLIQSDEADTKAEASEILKGVVGPDRTDALISILTHSAEINDEGNIDFLFDGGEGSALPSIICGMLATILKDNFSRRKKFIVACFEHPIDSVRFKAFETFVSHETNSSEINLISKQMSTDPSHQIAVLAQQYVK